PDNIMIGKGRAGADLVKVVDFGIAKAAASDEQKVTKTGMVVGTPEYMSPEQLSGDPLDARSDIYSLGLVTFNMLTGTLPFPGESMQETMIMRLTDDPKALGEMKPDVVWPGALQAVMDKALARDANKRYRNAHEFAVDLVQAIDRMPATSITTMGTQIVAAPMTPHEAATAATIQVHVPATRVASKSDPRGQQAAEDSGERALGRAAPAGTPTKSKAGLFAGVGGLAAAVLIAAVVLKPWASKTDPNSTNSTPTVTTPTTLDSGKVVASTGNPTPPPTAVNLNNSLVNVAESVSVFGRYLEKNAGDSVSEANAGREILKRLSTIDPKTPADRVGAALVEYRAKLALGQSVEACLLLKDIQELSAGTSLKSMVDRKLEACQ
ncbi:MAG: serine/threonine-protein kinase, partial [Gemmatimonadaceae bacterium]